MHTWQHFLQRPLIGELPPSPLHRLQKVVSQFPLFLQLLYSGKQSFPLLLFAQPVNKAPLAGTRSVVAIARTMKSSFVVFMFLYCEEGNNLVRERIYITWSSDLKCAIVPENFLYGCVGACRAPWRVLIAGA